MDYVGCLRKYWGRQDARPISTLEELYVELNEELFENSLPPVEQVKLKYCTYEEAKDYLGLFECVKIFSPRPKMKEGSGVISIRQGMTSRQTRKTMVHEMCHLATMIRFFSMNHCENFWRLMKSVGYDKSHRFIDQLDCEQDIFSQKNENKEAAHFWRFQETMTRVKFQNESGYYYVESQKRGTKVKITDGSKLSWWVPASSVVPCDLTMKMYAACNQSKKRKIS